MDRDEYDQENFEDDSDEDYVPVADEEDEFDDEDQEMDGETEEPEADTPAGTDTNDRRPIVIDIRDLFGNSDTSGGLTWESLAQLLARAGSGRTLGVRRTTGSTELWGSREERHYQYSPHQEPQPEGLAILRGGEFGNPDITKQPLQKTLRESKLQLDRSIKGELFKGLVPNSTGTVVARYGSNVYAGQFSTDSTFYYTCVQDFRLHIYDTRAAISKKPFVDGDHQATMKHNMTIRASPGGWTITDSHLSPDNSLLAYAIMSPCVFVASTQEPNAEQRSLHFGQSRSSFEWHERYGIWSCRFSADGKELVAGGSGKLMVYDLIADRRSVKIEAHAADVNSCCWADSGGNVLLSASDDSFLKVWDRRSLGSNPKPSGVFIGHTEGITYVSPKGDGRYVISNGKDQTLKLWDLRKMASYGDFARVQDDDYGIPEYDYRHQIYPKPRYQRHPNDCSVMSYRGHSVLRTLIRCNFSPAETTGSRYIYSGSADGIVHIWNLDGTVVQKIDRRNVIDMSYDPSWTEPPPIVSDTNVTRRDRGSLTVVRDVAWHSQEPTLMSCSWSTHRRQWSEVAKHEWKGLNKMGGRLEDFVEREKLEAKERRVPHPPRSGWY